MHQSTGGSNARSGFLLILAITAVVCLLPMPALASSTIASTANPWLIFSPGLMLFVGLAWFSRRGSTAETLEFCSGAETVFTHSTVVGSANARRPAAIVATPHHPDWDMADSIYSDLAHCKWIAESPVPSIREAMTGGHYFFEHTFQMPQPLPDGAVVELLALPDNWCTPTINGKEFARKGGKVDLFAWDLSEFVKPGANILTLEIENNPGIADIPDDPHWPEWNPYGIKYMIRVSFPS